MGSGKEFRYAPLVHPRSIRLLRLIHSADSNAVVRCTLETVDLGNKPDYIALSYTWLRSYDPEYTLEREGHPDDRRDRWIVVDGAKLDVTRNLNHFLLRLRHDVTEPQGIWSRMWSRLSRQKAETHQEWKPLWIDAICINQGDVSERNAQVSMMAQIYSSAAVVVVWLGQADQNAAAVLEDIRTLAWGWTNNRKEIHEGHMYYGSRAYSDAELLSEFGLSNWTPQRWQAVGNFFRNKWFCRLWICQEVALASKLHILWGGADVQWGLIVPCCAFLGRTELMAQAQGQAEGDEKAKLLSLLRYTSSIVQVLNLHQMREDCQPGESGESGASWSNATSSIGVLEELLLKTRHCKAHDPRDRVFGLLGILERRCELLGVEKLPLRPDYGLTAAQLYQQVTMLLISETRSLRILSLVNFIAKENLLCLPSWVPDYSHSIKAHLQLPENVPKGCSFDASRKSPSSLEFEFEQATLKLQSMRLATVSRVGQEKSDLGWEFNFERIARIILGAPCVDLNGQTHIEAFWRACLLDMADGEHPAPAELERSFAAWLLGRLIDRLDECLSSGWSLSGYLASMPSYKELEESDTRKVIPPLTTLVEIWHQLGQSPRQAGQKRGSDGAVAKDLCKDAQGFERAMDRSSYGLIFGTREGYIGNGPILIGPGDTISIIKGSDVPLATRTEYNPMKGELECYLVGEVYLHGVMHGEALDGGEPEWETLCLS